MLEQIGDRLNLQKNENFVCSQCACVRTSYIYLMLVYPSLLCFFFLPSWLASFSFLQAQLLLLRVPRNLQQRTH